MYKIIFCAFLLNYLVVIDSEVINKDIERTIDLTSQLVKITTVITLENTGKSPLLNYFIFFEPQTSKNVSYISCKDANKKEIVVKKSVWEADKSQDAYSIKLNQAIAPGRSATIKLETVFSHALIPYPHSITQKDRQLVKYFGSHYFYSPYATTKQQTTVIVNSKSIESYSKLKPVSQTDSTVVYGPYQNVAGSTLDSLSIHFESNAPFLTVTRLERSIEVSHWGSIAIEEHIDILHTGAKLKGPFSRYDYQRDTNTNHHSIKSYKTILPASAHSTYYRDSNGNISTSQVRVRKDWIELELRPRYPLFGGWKSSYTLGYSVPSYQYLYKAPKDNQYVLRMRLMDNVFDDMHVAELETNVVLPVGVTDVKLTTPYDVQRLPNGIMYKYLDSKGRPIVRFSKKNLVEQHIQDFEISYKWQPILLLHEPFLLSVALYILFVAVIVYVRLDFSISKPEHVKTQ